MKMKHRWSGMKFQLNLKFQLIVQQIKATNSIHSGFRRNYKCRTEISDADNTHYIMWLGWCFKVGHIFPHISLLMGTNTCSISSKLLDAWFLEKITPLSTVVLFNSYVSDRKSVFLFNIRGKQRFPSRQECRVIIGQTSWNNAQNDVSVLFRQSLFNIRTSLLVITIP